MEVVQAPPLDKRSNQPGATPLSVKTTPFPYSPVARTDLDFKGAVILPFNELGMAMAPFEAATDVPLPIVGRGLEGKTNSHHAFYYKEWYRKCGMGLRATRYSRLQEVDRLDHKAFHDTFKGGAVRPESDDVMFRLAILGFAAYVPRYAFNARTGSVVELNNAQRHRLRRPGIFTIEGEPGRIKYHTRAIGEFLMRHSLNQKFDPGRIALIEEFLSLTPDKIEDNDVLRQKKDRLGMKLTNIAIGSAVNPLDATYREAQREKCCGDPRAVEDPPKSAFDEVKRLVGGHEPRYFGTLEEILAKQYPEALVA